MNTKTKATCLLGLISIFMTAPIWYYLLYRILQYVQADSLMWFLFWAYVPIGFVVSILTSVTTSLFEDKK